MPRLNRHKIISDSIMSKPNVEKSFSFTCNSYKNTSHTKSHWELQAKTARLVILRSLTVHFSVVPHEK